MFCAPHLGGCPPGYEEIGDSCYKLVSETDKYTFGEGAALCKETGGYLLTIQSQTENKKIAEAFNKKGLTAIYLGGELFLFGQK